MKTIYLIRHAKSSWATPSLSDFDRPLNSRGKNDAPLIGKELRKLGFNPERIISSPSVRTTKTIQLICNEVNYKLGEVTFNQQLYHASLIAFKELINFLDNQQNSIALVGHNFGISDFANYLTANKIGVMPTCAAVKITLNVDAWEEIIEGLGSIEFYIYPKML